MAEQNTLLEFPVTKWEVEDDLPEVASSNVLFDRNDVPTDTVLSMSIQPKFEFGFLHLESTVGVNREIKDEFPETASSNMSLNQNDAQMEMLSSPSLQPKSEFGLFHQQKHEIKDEFPETASSNMSLNQNDAQMEMLSSPSLQPKSEFGLFHQQKHEIKDEFPETAGPTISLNQNDAPMETLSSPSLQPKSEFGLFHQEKHEVEDMFPGDGFLGTADNTSWPKNEGIFTNISQNLSVQVKLESDSSENEPFVDEVEDMFPVYGFLGTAGNTSWPKNEGSSTNIFQNQSLQVKLESCSSENEPFVDDIKNSPMSIKNQPLEERGISQEPSSIRYIKLKIDPPVVSPKASSLSEQQAITCPKAILQVEKISKQFIKDTRNAIWRCRFCDQVENSSLILDLHQSTECEQLSQIQCKLCFSIFSNYSTFVVHYIEHKLGEKRQCPICLHEGISDIRQHLLSYGHLSQSSTKKYRCYICGKNFSTNKAMISHRKTHLKPHKCEVCEKRFSSKNSLTCHKRIHSGERPYKCKICNKTFNKINILTSHLKVHSDEKSYECGICGKTFTYKRTLSKHKRIHTGERPFKCDFCEKSFALPWILKIHLRLHTGEKPFKCDLCNKAYICSSSLYFHKKSHNSKSL
ncbi:hypothetical protein QYM36_016041 [Artemia franciscana]|uniref:C2H2-type domain-containing protein n=1 Tax=Artemia franciscana TaxID=6661 RepID=A0AA88H6V8_ARTSF|nr:hypothetical protein QYM36_016041 [Artemia franciscana]